MPKPINDSVRTRLRAQRTRDTGPELALRRLLHSRGLRYRVDARPLPDMRIKADVVFTRAKVAVFIDGCFWHGCPEHFMPPKNNAEWWAAKIQVNRERDRRTRAVLAERGWIVISAWEHVPAQRVALDIADAVGQSRVSASGA